MYSTNEIYLYQLRRNIVSLPSSVDPGLPSNGFYSMRYEVRLSDTKQTILKNIRISYFNILKIIYNAVEVNGFEKWGLPA